MKYQMFDMVRALVDVPSFSIKTGDVGAIVEIYDDGELEVEFCSEKGETLAMFAMTEQQIAPVANLRKAA